MAVSYTTSKLIESVKRRGMFPTSQQLFTDRRIVDFANDELQQTIVPIIMSMREDYFVVHKDINAEGDSPFVVEVPDDAVGMKLKGVGQLVDNVYISLPRIQENEINRRFLYGFTVEGNQLKVYSNVKNTFRLYYYQRTLELCLEKEASQIVSIDSLTNEVQVNAIPSSWNTSTVLNAVQSVQPFRAVKSEAQIISLSSPLIRLDSVDDLKVGDWLAVEGYSPIPQIPVEAQKVLEQGTVVKCLESVGDREGMAAAEKKYEINVKNMMTVLAPRVDQSPKKINSDPYGRWNSTRFRRWW